jgi:hypothetical protein
MSNKEEQLVLYPTDTSQWYALVNEAQVRQLCHLDEELESYLVFLLMRYTNQPQMLSSVLALDFLDSRVLLGRQRFIRLRDLGDKSLLFAGLFPGIAEKRRVSLDYFVDLGQSAYAMISLEEVGDVTLFASLCHEFRLLQDLLSVMRDLTGYSESLVIDCDNQDSSKIQ